MKWIRRFLNRLGDLSPRQLIAISVMSALSMFGLMYAALTELREEESMNMIVPAVESPKETETKTVVVAKTNIQAQTPLRSEMLELKEVPEDIIPANAVFDEKEVLNRSTKVAIFEGDFITPQKVFGDDETSGFVGMIPTDCRAVSVSVNDVTGVAGFAKPGDRVDVVLVEKSDDSATSSILLQDVLLLSINGDMGVKSSSDENVDPATQAINNPTIATLALKPNEVLQLISASKIGSIYLMLRPLKPSVDYVDGGGITFRSYKAPKREAESKTPVPAPAVVAPVPSVPSLPAVQPKQDTKSKDDLKEESEKESPKFEIMYGDKPDDSDGKDSKSSH